MSSRVTAFDTEVLYVGAPNVRVTEIITEVVRDGSPQLKVTELLAEVARNGSPVLRITEVVFEILRSTANTTNNFQSVSDTVHVAETLVGWDTINRQLVSDTVTIAETRTGRASVNKTVTDAITVAETLTARNNTSHQAVSDSVNVATTITERDNTTYISLTDSVTASEVIVAKNTSTYITITDNVHAVEVRFARNNTIRITVTDSIHTGEAQGERDSVNRIALTSLVHVTDTVTARTTEVRKTILENIHITETIFQINPNPIVTDHVTVHETISFITSFVFLTVHDSIHVTETLHCNPLDMPVSDHVTVSSRIAFYTSPFNKGMTDGVTVTEKIIGHGPIVSQTLIDHTHVAEQILTNYPLYHVSDTITVKDTLVTSPHTTMKVFDTVTVHDIVNSKISPVRVKDLIFVNEKIEAYTKNKFITITDTVQIFDLVTSKILSIQKVSDGITVRDFVSVTNVRQLLNDTIAVNEHIHFSPVHIYVTDTVHASDSVKRLSFLVQDHITVNDFIGLELTPPGLIHKLDIVDSVTYNKIITRSVTDYINVTEFMNLHGSIHVINLIDYLPINDSGHPRTTNLGGNTIIVPDLVGVIVNPKLMQLQTEDAQIQLPAAQLGDSREIVGQVNVVKAMEGTTRQFIQQTPRIRLNYTWKLSHIKVYELRAFVIASLSKIVTITDWNGIVYAMNIIKNPFDFSNQGVYKKEKEFAIVAMEFEGIRMSGN